MEEKKKRWRPSLTAYRELEKKLESQIDGTSQLVKDCDLWREKYRELKKQYDEVKDSFTKLVEHSAEADAERVRLLGENERLRNRSFIDRLLNR